MCTVERRSDGWISRWRDWWVRQVACLVPPKGGKKRGTNQKSQKNRVRQNGFNNKKKKTTKVDDLFECIDCILLFFLLFVARSVSVSPTVVLWILRRSGAKRAQNEMCKTVGTLLDTFVARRLFMSTEKLLQCIRSSVSHPYSSGSDMEKRGNKHDIELVVMFVVTETTEASLTSFFF